MGWTLPRDPPGNTNLQCTNGQIKSRSGSPGQGWTLPRDLPGNTNVKCTYGQIKSGTSSPCLGWTLPRDLPGNTNVQCTNEQIKNGTAPQLQAGLSQGTYTWKSNVQCTNGHIKSGTAPQVLAELSQRTYLEIHIYQVSCTLHTHFAARYLLFSNYCALLRTTFISIRYFYLVIERVYSRKLLDSTDIITWYEVASCWSMLESLSVGRSVG